MRLWKIPSSARLVSEVHLPFEDGNNSRKICPQKAVAKIGCGFFDQPDLQLLNDYKFFFFSFATVF